jgi:predicted DNA-binding transcriptional regulator AlpA
MTSLPAIPTADAVERFIPASLVERLLDDTTGTKIPTAEIERLVAAATPADDKLLRIAEVVEGPDAICRMSRTAFYRAIRAGDLPEPIKVGRISFWRASDIRAAFSEMLFRAGGVK